MRYTTDDEQVTIEGPRPTAEGSLWTVTDREHPGVHFTLELGDWPPDSPEPVITAATASKGGVPIALRRYAGILAAALADLMALTGGPLRGSARRPPRSRRPASDELLAEVAKVYTDAPDGGRIPALRELHPEASDSTIYRWIKACRERGLLPEREG